MKKRVLIFSHELPPFIGGVGTVAKQLAEWFIRNKAEVDILTRTQKTTIKIEGVNIFKVDASHKLWFLSYNKYIKNNLDLDSYDLIILNEAAPTISAGMFFSASTLSKCLVYVHGLEIENIYANHIKNIPRQLFGFKFFHRRAVKHCNKLISVGNHMNKKFLSYSGIKYLENKTEIILAGIDCTVFKKEVLPKKNKKTFKLVSASRIVKEKGYFEKLEIFQNLILSGLKLQWIICGDGNDLDELKYAVKEKKLDDFIVFKGICTRKELNTIYNEANLFWLLSRYDEALPLVYIEAQMSGIPAIGWNKGGTIDTIKNSVSGYLVNDIDDCIDKITKIYYQNLMLNEKEILQFASDFDMNKTLDKLAKYL